MPVSPRRSIEERRELLSNRGHLVLENGYGRTEIYMDRRAMESLPDLNGFIAVPSDLHLHSADFADRDWAYGVILMLENAQSSASSSTNEKYGAWRYPTEMVFADETQDLHVVFECQLGHVIQYRTMHTNGDIAPIPIFTEGRATIIGLQIAS